nr:MAG TPA: hypothetical protein [Caudoviricetes sp.]
MALTLKKDVFQLINDLIDHLPVIALIVLVIIIVSFYVFHIRSKH